MNRSIPLWMPRLNLAHIPYARFYRWKLVRQVGHVGSGILLGKSLTKARI